MRCRIFCSHRMVSFTVSKDREQIVCTVPRYFQHSSFFSALPPCALLLGTFCAALLIGYGNNASMQWNSDLRDEQGYSALFWAISAYAFEQLMVLPQKKRTSFLRAAMKTTARFEALTMFENVESHNGSKCLLDLLPSYAIGHATLLQLSDSFVLTCKDFCMRSQSRTPRFIRLVRSGREDTKTRR